jgi:hypothetical protein
VIASFLFVCAMYTYPPVRVQLPLTLIPLFWYGHVRAQKLDVGLNRLGEKIKFTAAFFIPMGLLLLPLAVKTLSGEIQRRFNTISIFNSDYLHSIGKTSSLKDLIEVFIHNYTLHFQKAFLFISGDPSFVHSTGHFGIFSWLDTTALIIGVIFLFLLFSPKLRTNNPWMEHRSLLIFLMASYLIGFIPVALTNSELPNSLRICGAWPFLCLFSGFFLWKLSERVWVFWPALVLTGALFAYSFFNVYFQKFPGEGKGMFGFWTIEQAKTIKTDEDWVKFLMFYRNDDYQARYYLIQKRQVSCKKSKIMWQNMQNYAFSKGIY